MVQAVSNLEDLRASHRLLCVFSPSKQDRLYQIQMDTLEGHQLALYDHNVVVAEVFENEDGLVGEIELPCDGCHGLRQEFHIMPGQFKVVLLEKDASVTLSAESYVSCEEVFMRVENKPGNRKINAY